MSNWEDFFTNVVELMTSNSTPSPQVASASSENTNYEAFRAFDHSDFTRWRSTKFDVSESSSSSSHSSPAGSISSSTMEYFEGEWLKIDFGVGNQKTVRHYKLTLPETDNAPIHWSFEGSNNDTNWTILDIQTGTWINPDNSKTALMLVVDISGSMGWENRLVNAKTALIDFVNDAPSHIEQIGLISFSNNAQVRQDFTSVRADVITAINALSANGGTNYKDGLKKTLQRFDAHAELASYNKAVFFMSDGKPNTGEEGEKYYTSGSSENSFSSRDIVIHSCAYGSGITCTGPYGTWLQDMADNTDGTCNIAPDGDVLKEITEGIFSLVDLTYECVNPSDLAFRYYRLNIWANKADTDNTEVVQWFLSEQNLGECESSSASTPTSLSSQSTSSSSSSKSSSSTSSLSSSSTSSSSLSSSSSSSSSSISSQSSSSSRSSSSRSSKSSLSSVSSSFRSSSSSPQSSSSIYDKIVRSRSKYLTYLSNCKNFESISNPLVGKEVGMTVRGHFSEDVSISTFEDYRQYAFQGGLNKTLLNQATVYAPDASNLFSMGSGMVRIYLSVPYPIQHGLFGPVTNKEDYYLRDYIIMGVNLGDFYTTQPGIYAAFTPDGIEFTHWSKKGRHTVLDTQSNISANESFTISFMWDKEGLFTDLQANMAISINDELTAFDTAVLGNDSLQGLYSGDDVNEDANFCLLDTPMSKSMLTGTVKRIEIYSTVAPESIVSSNSSQSPLSSSSFSYDFRRASAPLSFTYEIILGHKVDIQPVEFFVVAKTKVNLASLHGSAPDLTKQDEGVAYSVEKLLRHKGTTSDMQETKE